jgi:hypothetical protein
MSTCWLPTNTVHADLRHQNGLHTEDKVSRGWPVTKLPASLMYASMVTWEPVQIAFLITAFNDMSGLGGNISNAYLTAPTTEKVWTILVPEWGSDAGKMAIIV